MSLLKIKVMGTTNLKNSVGIDFGLKTFRCCYSIIDMNQNVKVKATRKFNNTPADRQELLEWIRKHHKEKEIGLSITMEATGVYYEPCALMLQREGYRVSVVLPTKARRYMQALGLKTKNDKIDAEGLARMGAEQQLKEWEPLSPLYYGLRQLTRQHEDIQKSITAHKNQLHAAQHGMYRFDDIEDRYQSIITTQQSMVKEIEKLIEQSIESNVELSKKIKRLCAIKGLGMLSAACVIAETNGFALFENSKQLVSYAGYDVVEDQSGKHVGKTKISKKGNSHIRRILHLPAFNVVTHKVKPFKSLFERVFERTRIKMKGYVAVQRKLLVMIYTLWKTDRDFNENWYKQITIREEEVKPSFGLAS